MLVTVLLVDAHDRLGRAGRAPAGSVWAAHARALQPLTPRRRPLVDVGRTGQVDERRPARAATQPAWHTDARRLGALRLGAASHVLVVRPGATLLPMRVLAELAALAIGGAIDLATLDGVPPAVCYVVRRTLVDTIAGIPPVPGATTIPEVCARVGSASLPVTHRVFGADVLAGDWQREAIALPAASWREPVSSALLALESVRRLGVRLADEHGRLARARARVRRLTGVPSRKRETRRVLVLVPSPFQSGAHAAWRALLPYLPVDRVVFAVSASTTLARDATRRGFDVTGLSPDAVPGGGLEAADVFSALARIRPAVLHLDGAESTPWAGIGASRGLRVVQHVRLNHVERFSAAWPWTDAVVAVSASLAASVASRTGPSVRVEHIADGVTLPRTRRRAPSGTTTCLCVGRVEPAKQTLRAIDIADALGTHGDVHLHIIGPVGADPGYADQVSSRVADSGGRVTWHAPTTAMAAWYRRADVVIVASRNEALGMVGLEALASGCLLAAQRTSGYEAIVGEGDEVGLLFEADETPARIAARMDALLGRRDHVARAARAHVASSFDACAAARRLSTLWRELGA